MKIISDSELKQLYELNIKLNIVKLLEECIMNTVLAITISVHSKHHVSYYFCSKLSLPLQRKICESHHV